MVHPQWRDIVFGEYSERFQPTLQLGKEIFFRKTRNFGKSARRSGGELKVGRFEAKDGSIPASRPVLPAAERPGQKFNRVQGCSPRAVLDLMPAGEAGGENCRIGRSPHGREQDPIADLHA
jgi:hypothetical protein